MITKYLYLLLYLLFIIYYLLFIINYLLLIIIIMAIKYSVEVSYKLEYELKKMNFRIYNIF